MNGYDAVKLWNEYQWGDESALELLLSYNSADTVNLKPMMEMAFEKMTAKSLGGMLSSSCSMAF